MREPPPDRRTSSRINQSQTVRVRPADTAFKEEVRTTLNVSWDGMYFATSLGHYFPGMMIYITRDFQSKNAANLEEEASVVRVDKLKEGRWGVAISLK